MISNEEKLDNLQKTEIKNQTFKLSGKNTVDINILLNRVRLDQKRALKKRIVFSIILAGLVSSLAIYFII